MKERYLITLYWVLLIAIFAVMVWQLSSEKFDTVRPIEKGGNYELRKEEMIPRENVGIMISADGKLYLYYLENELVNVYDRSGEYLYGFQFPDFQNGRSDLHYENGLLYVDDRGSGIYVFQDSELIRFEERHYQNEGHDELEEMFTGEYPHRDGEDTYVYVEENNRILRNRNGESETVIQFPQKSPHYNALLLLFAAWVLLGCNYHEIKKKIPGISG